MKGYPLKSKLIMKQACQDESVVSLFFSYLNVYIP